MICMICPRRCGAERTEHTGNGICRQPFTIRVARADLHFWEEPCVSGTKGSGTIFFSGCSLGCVFCQNSTISHEDFGQEITVERLREIMEELMEKGAHNINLVNPTHFTPMIKEALAQKPSVPVVWNTSGYERVETLRSLSGRVQIYLPDFKYMDAALAQEYSGAGDYPEVAKKAILEMVSQVGEPQLNEDGILQKGVILRHLMLPGALHNTKAVLDWVAESFPRGEVLFSLMAQYTPQENAAGLLKRRVTGSEYRAACQYMENLGITSGYMQDIAAAKSDYTPNFDLTGIKKTIFKNENL